ncbi:MAG: PrgI family protein, partial [Candidatus Woesearchaeota archaeon]
MTYEIPKNLTKYSEEFLFGFSFKNFIYLIGLLLAVVMILFRLDHAVPEFWLRIVITIPFLIIGLLLIVFKIDEKLVDLINFKRSTRNSSYFDGKTDSFVEVEEIVDDTVILKDGTIIGILEIKPLDFFILSKEEKDTVLKIYQGWLRSLDYPVQILSRSLNIDLSKWLKNLEKRESAIEDKEHFNEFSSWISQEIENNQARNRQFYILIPQRKGVIKNSLGEDLKGIFTGRFTGPVDKESEEYK